MAWSVMDAEVVLATFSVWLDTVDLRMHTFAHLVHAPFIVDLAMLFTLVKVGKAKSKQWSLPYNLPGKHIESLKYSPRLHG